MARTATMVYHFKHCLIYKNFTTMNARVKKIVYFHSLTRMIHNGSEAHTATTVTARKRERERE